MLNGVSVCHEEVAMCVDSGIAGMKTIWDSNNSRDISRSLLSKANS